MIQKATWIIPGILVTLLLGLLWAMPAFAADAGEIEFQASSASDADAVSYVSLNGPAAVGGFWVQVTDQDLNEPTKYTGANAFMVDNPSGENVLDAEYDWTDLADRNDDGSINYKDFTALHDGPDDELGTDDDVAVTVARADIDLDVTNGKLKWTPTGGATHLEFHLDERLTIGAFVTDQSDDVALNNDQRVDGQIPDLDNAGETKIGELPNVREFVNPTGNVRLRDDDGTATWASVLADPDGDGNLAEHITATVSVPYMALNDADPPVPVGKSVDDVELKVSVIETLDDEEEPDGGYEIHISSVGVTVSPTDDVDTSTIANLPITTAVKVNITLDENDPDVEINISTAITISYPTVYVGMGEMDQIGVVTVDSSGGTRTSVALRETSASSGMFGTDVMICDSGDKTNCKADQEVSDEPGDRPGMAMMPVDKAGDTITVRYRDAAPRTNRSENISLDTNAPAFSGFTPDSGTAGKDAEPDVSFEVVDGESGIASDDDDDAGSLRIVAALFEADAETDSVIFGPVVLDRDDLNVDELTDGFSVEARLREGGNENELNAGSEEEYEIRWWAVAMDVAGNTGVSDSDSDTPCTYSGEALYDDEGALTVDDLLVAVMAADKVGTDDEVNCDPHVIRVDAAAPNLVSAVTGVFFDADEPNDEGTGSLTSIVARFDEALDCDSVTADDFEVDGTAPNDATCKGSNVYLDVDEMDSNDTPDVSVAEEAVGDRAGNLIGEDAEVESTDGVPAGISVTVVGTASGDRPVTNETITITVSSDEKLSGRPMVQIRKVGNNYALGDSDFGGTADPTGNTNEWEFEEDLDDAGLYNVYVTAEDRVNSGDSMAGLQPGVVGPDPEDATKKVTSTTKFTLDADDLKSNKIILFEVDNAVSDPVFRPEDDGDTDEADMFIRVNFSNEGKEYAIAAKCAKDDEDDKAVNDDGACDDVTYTVSSVDVDTQSTITLVSASFNGEDVMEDVISRDDILFLYRPGGLTDGDHKLELEVEDSAGNEEEFTLEFEKVPQKPYKLPINPGSNLVSFPANPIDGDINAVFGGEGNEDILSVFTYNNSSGLWLTANKGADGTFAGELTTINGMNGYWVVADSVLDISVLLQRTADATRPPPHIAVSHGWNLVGVVDTQQREAGHRAFASSYFANIDAEVAYGFREGRLHRVSLPESVEDLDLFADDDIVVENGKGYWVYANEAGVIIP